MLLSLLLTSKPKLKIWESSIRTISAVSNVTEDRNVKLHRNIPGPSRFPVIGQLPHFLPGGSLYNRQNMWRDLYERHGPIVQLNGLFLPSALVLYDADAIEEVFRKENALPMRPGLQAFIHYRTHHSTLATDKHVGLAFESGESWKYLRSIINPVLLKPDVIKKYEESVKIVAQDMVERLKFLQRQYTDTVIPKLFDELKLWAFETNAQISIGKRFDCLNLVKNIDDDIPEYNFLRHMSGAFSLSTELDTTGIIWTNLNYNKMKKFKRLMQQMESFSEYHIEIAKKAIKDSNKNSNENNSLLADIMKKDEELASLLTADVFFGGIDLVATTVMIAMYWLAMNPKTQHKLRMELTNNQKGYLKACLKESSRLIPTIPIVPRTTTREYDLLGFKIPKNTSIFVCQQNSVVSEKHFDRATEFLPERWLLGDKHNEISCRNVHPFAHNPFGFGTRSCIGRRIAMMQIEEFLARLIENFNVEWRGPPPEFEMKAYTYIKAPKFVLKVAEPEI